MSAIHMGPKEWSDEIRVRIGRAASEGFKDFGSLLMKVVAEIQEGERERCANTLEARAAELEPLEKKPELTIWKHGFLLGLAAAIRKP